MAGNRPGPAKGSGGRPRVAKQKPNGEGYIRKTVGPPGNGKLVYAHRAEAGLANVKGSKGKGTVVDHGNSRRTDNSAKNLTVMSKGQNTAKSNKKRAGK